MVKISYTPIKNTFFRESERERKNKSPISRILLFNSDFFCKIRQKIECSFLPSALISRSTIMK